jgi:hypothetical protein
LGYRDFTEWSGANTDRARRRAAKNMARALGTLAERRGCTPERPLHVNFVAHSHGGNVALAALEHLPPTVKPRQVCLLGTPLTWRFTDLRFLYLFYVFLWLGLMSLGLWAAFAEDTLTSHFNEHGANLGMTPWDTLGILIELYLPVLIFLPVPLWLSVLAVGIARGLFGLLPGRPAYGPKPKQLEKMLGGRPVVLFISPEDEADLMLHVGAAPLDVYRAMIRGRPGSEGVKLLGRPIRQILRWIEFLYVRPFSYAVLVPLVEILLERHGLGFPYHSVLVRNYEMVSWLRNRKYTPTQLFVHKISAAELHPRSLNVNLSQQQLVPASVAAGSGPAPAADRVQALRNTLLSTLDGLKKQLHLRHSGYYESENVIWMVARTLAAPSPPATQGQQQLPSYTPAPPQYPAGVVQ